VSFHQPTVAQGRACWPGEFIDLLGTQLLVALEVEYGSSAAGRRPSVAVAMNGSSALQLDLWFQAVGAPKKSLPTVQ